MKHIVNRTLQTTTTFIHLPAEYNVLAPTKEAVPADLVSRSLQARMVSYKYQTALNMAVIVCSLRLHRHTHDSLTVCGVFDSLSSYSFNVIARCVRHVG